MFVDLLRHGNAPKVPGIDDLYRPLSDLGKNQSLETRALYNGQNRNIKLVLYSPAPRALCTAAIVVGKAEPLFVMEHQLWVYRTQQDGPALWAAFEKHGYNLLEYLDDPDAYGPMMGFGKRSAITVRQKMSAITNANQKDGDIILVAGHAVCLNYTAFWLSNQTSVRLLEVELGEAGRVRLIFEDGNYTGFEV